MVQTSCTDCHEVPDKVIKCGLVTINHAEFVSYKASCEESCHKKEIHKTSKVDNNVCLNCHSFSKEQHADVAELHQAHTSLEKVEFFACHGQVSHGRTEVASISVMMDCQNCHSDTHQAQRTIYATQHPMQTQQTDRVLSPMFLTHVECTGCHIERVARKSGVLDSYGTVAKAVPQACDKCHEEGTGQQYIPFWQEKIKAMLEKVSRKLEQLKARARNTTNEQVASQLNQSIEQAQSILESVSADGSWGVHNFKYTEAQRQILDFYHAREYISKAASAIFGRDKKSRDAWINDWSHRLKHKQGTMGRLLKELESKRANLDSKNFIERDEEIRHAIVYYTNNKNRMSYTSHLKHNLPIGSSVTEVACKTVVKQRMCVSGSRWKDAGASCVLALRTLKLTKGRWQQFWSYVMRHGCTEY